MKRYLMLMIKNNVVQIRMERPAFAFSSMILRSLAFRTFRQSSSTCFTHSLIRFSYNMSAPCCRTETAALEPAYQRVRDQEHVECSRYWIEEQQQTTGGSGGYPYERLFRASMLTRRRDFLEIGHTPIRLKINLCIVYRKSSS